MLYLYKMYILTKIFTIVNFKKSVNKCTLLG